MKIINKKIFICLSILLLPVLCHGSYQPSQDMVALNNWINNNRKWIEENKLKPLPRQDLYKNLLTYEETIIDELIILPGLQSLNIDLLFGGMVTANDDIKNPAPTSLNAQNIKRFYKVIKQNNAYGHYQNVVIRITLISKNNQPIKLYYKDTWGNPALKPTVLKNDTPNTGHRYVPACINKKNIIIAGVVLVAAGLAYKFLTNKFTTSITRPESTIWEKLLQNNNFN